MGKVSELLVMLRITLPLVNLSKSVNESGIDCDLALGQKMAGFAIF